MNSISLTKLRINTGFVHSMFSIPLIVCAVGQVMTSRKKSFLKVMVADEEKATILTAFGDVAQALKMTLRPGDKVMLTNPKVQTPKFVLYGLVSSLNKIGLF